MQICLSLVSFIWTFNKIAILFTFILRIVNSLKNLLTSIDMDKKDEIVDENAIGRAI